MDDADGGEIFSVSSRREGSRAVIDLAGELDLDGSQRLETEVTGALDDGVERVTLEASNLTFTDSAGLRSMLIARAEAERRGIEFRLGSVSDPVMRIMKIAGLEELLPDAP